MLVPTPLSPSDSLKAGRLSLPSLPVLLTTAAWLPPPPPGRPPLAEVPDRISADLWAACGSVQSSSTSRFPPVWNFSLLLLHWPLIWGLLGFLLWPSFISTCSPWAISPPQCRWLPHIHSLSLPCSRSVSKWHLPSPREKTPWPDRSLALSQKNGFSSSFNSRLYPTPQAWRKEP